MNHSRWLRFSLILFLTIAHPFVSFSADQSQKVQSALENLKARTKGKFTVRWQEDKSRIKVLDGELSAPHSGPPQQAAMKFLAENPDLFRLDRSIE